MEAPKKINSFVLASSKDISSAKYVLFGSDDERGSKGLAYFEGSTCGPMEIRKASHLRNAFHRTEQGKLKTFVVNSFAPLNREDISFADIGNVVRPKISETITTLLQNKQFPIMLGGDHSLSYEVLKGVDRVHKKFAIVYFDAHPDFRSSDSAGRQNYATVMYDATKLKSVQNKHCIQIGVRDIEPEEFTNKREANVPWLTSLDVQKIGLNDTLDKIKSTVGKLPIYISVDLDVLDRAFAPGVSTPSPGGLMSRELLFLLTELAHENVIGLDIVEHTPDVDIQTTTAHIGAKLIIEFVVRHNLKKI